MDAKGAPIEMEVLDASKVVSMDEFNISIPRRKDEEVAGRNTGVKGIPRVI